MIINFKMMIPADHPFPDMVAANMVKKQAAEELTKKIMELLEVETACSIERGFNVFSVCFDTADLDRRAEEKSE